MDIILTIITSAIASLVTFLITTIWYQSRKEKKQNKVAIFKVLMSTRDMADYDAIKALNSIDIVFSDSHTVTEAWHRYHKSLGFEGKQPTVKEKNEIIVSRSKMFEAMAENLGYKNITWDIIEKPYSPKWLTDAQQAQMQFNQNMLEGRH